MQPTDTLQPAPSPAADNAASAAAEKSVREPFERMRLAWRRAPFLQTMPNAARASMRCS